MGDGRWEIDLTSYPPSTPLERMLVSQPARSAGNDARCGLVSEDRFHWAWLQPNSAVTCPRRLMQTRVIRRERTREKRHKVCQRDGPRATVKAAFSKRCPMTSS